MRLRNTAITGDINQRGKVRILFRRAAKAISKALIVGALTLLPAKALAEIPKKGKPVPQKVDDKKDKNNWCRNSGT